VEGVGRGVVCSSTYRSDSQQLRSAPLIISHHPLSRLVSFLHLHCHCTFIPSSSLSAVLIAKLAVPSAVEVHG
jgi:hypothetical protein